MTSNLENQKKKQKIKYLKDVDRHYHVKKSWRDRDIPYWNKMRKTVKYDEEGHPIGWISREYAKEMRPYREDVNAEIEDAKLAQLFQKKMRKQIKTKIPKHEQKTVRVAVIGRPNCGKSSVINMLLGWDACPVGSEPGSTRMNQFQTTIYGDTMFEIVDVPGVPDKINPDTGVGEYTFRRDNVAKAKKLYGGNCLLAQNANSEYVSNDLFIKNADVVVVCCALDSRVRFRLDSKLLIHYVLR